MTNPLKTVTAIFDDRVWSHSCVIGRPPSANELYYIDWRRKARRKTSSYATWRRSTAATMARSFKTLDGPAQVEIIACIDRKADLDNLVKPIADALSDSGCVRNDRWIDRVQIHRLPKGRGLPEDLVIVALAPWDPNTTIRPGP